uniref:Uncharacterized protein n=1 Tax=Arundo donax TaxID=35708 RepID=A0A0A8YCG9_ARUDO
MHCAPTPEKVSRCIEISEQQCRQINSIHFGQAIYPDSTVTVVLL